MTGLCLGCSPHQTLWSWKMIDKVKALLILLQWQHFKSLGLCEWLIKCLIITKHHWLCWIVSIPDILGTFQAVWKLPRYPGNFSRSLETVQDVWKLFRQFGNSPDILETFQAHKILRGDPEIYKFCQHKFLKHLAKLISPNFCKAYFKWKVVK